MTYPVVSMLHTDRYVVDLYPFGGSFKNSIRQIIARERFIDLRDYELNVHYVYEESARQIVDMLDCSLDEFSLKLLSLPDFNYFKHMVEFGDSYNRELFRNGIREFAMNLLFSINSKVGVFVDRDYLLDAITNDYIVICVVNKGT